MIKKLDYLGNTRSTIYQYRIFDKQSLNFITDIMTFRDAYAYMEKHKNEGDYVIAGRTNVISEWKDVTETEHGLFDMQEDK